MSICRLLVWLGLSVLLLLAPPAPAQEVKPKAPVIEEEEPVRPAPAKSGAPVVEEEEPVRPPVKPDAPVVEEEQPVRPPATPGAPVVEEEPDARPVTTPKAPQVIEDDTPASSTSSDDTLLSAPSVISLPRIDLRLFADAGYEYRRLRNEVPYNAFEIGTFDIFATSKLNDKVSVLAELLFQNQDGNLIQTRGVSQYRADLERAVLRYRQNKYLTVDFGRFHSSLSYYNSTFHRGRWFETSAERPYIAAWEDEGGVLPSRAVGVQVSGALPSPEALPVSYFFEVTNGRAFTGGVNGIQSSGDTDGMKATNVGFVVKPARLPGLELGASLYRDRLDPGQGSRWNEKIMTFRAVYQRGNIQFLNEFAHLRHQRGGLSPLGGVDAMPGLADRSSISGVYSQFGYRFGKLVPYFRFDYLNAPGANPIARSVFGAGAGTNREFSSGVFYDLSSFSALKFQVDRFRQHNVRGAHAVVQLAFAF